MKKILFVCTGNTCRSSMAEAIFNHLAQNHPVLASTYRAHSAGISAIDNDPASSESVRVLEELWDVKLHTHRAKRLQKHHLLEADLILTMTRSHKQAILDLYPECSGKTFTLMEYVNEPDPSEAYVYNFLLDIADPYGMPLETYRKCAVQIRQAVEKLVEKLTSSING